MDSHSELCSLHMVDSSFTLVLTFFLFAVLFTLKETMTVIYFLFTKKTYSVYLLNTVLFSVWFCH